ncbi:MAG TPA: 5'-3' exonuclease H3TH domain-containing protein, partial [Steroidobacteraceae bacterium]|nr:5'-3' exonuclease H3TH domain-containing protein [Steroidobacteraceae bacterium]
SPIPIRYDARVIYLIDASVYVFRAYYSMPPEMADRDGNPAHATFGFARFLGDLIERVQPRYIAVAFDESLSTSFRNQIYPAYKANRDPPPEDLKLQFERCREFCHHAGIPAFGHVEYEADDIVGSLMTLCRRDGLRATLVTRDKDFAQLIGEGDVYWDYTDNAQYRYHQIEDRFGVAPERFADFLALMGDSVDNIKGVPGVGPKTAAALMKEFASLEELYDNLDKVAAVPVRGAGKLAAKLAEHREAAFLARKLTEIACHMPLTVSRTELVRRAPDLGALTAFFDRHNFGPTLRRQAERLASLPLAAAA